MLAWAGGGWWVLKGGGKGGQVEVQGGSGAGVTMTRIEARISVLVFDVFCQENRDGAGGRGEGQVRELQE